MFVYHMTNIPLQSLMLQFVFGQEYNPDGDRYLFALIIIYDHEEDC